MRGKGSFQLTVPCMTVCDCRVGAGDTDIPFHTCVSNVTVSSPISNPVMRPD